MAEIFISYSHSERDFVERLHSLLRGLDLDIWFDKTLKPTKRWRDEITRELRDAKVVITVWSIKSAASRWVLHESDVAFRDDRLISIFMDFCEIPAPFSEDQAIDLSDWSGELEHDGYLRLIEAIGEKLQRAELKEYALFRRFRNTGPEMTAGRRYRHYNYRDMLALCDSVRDEVRSFDPDAFFCFDSRGGLWAEMFFDRLTYRIPVIVGYRLKSSGPRKSDLGFENCRLIQTERWNLYVPPIFETLRRDAKILFVDDYSHTGDTCTRIKRFLIDEYEWKPDAVRTLTLITSPEASARGQRPDIVGVEEKAEIVDLFYMFRR